MKMKAILLRQFIKPSPNCYGSEGKSIFSRHSSLFPLSVFRCFRTKTVSRCNFRAKIQNINMLDDALCVYDSMSRIRPLPSVTQFNRLLSQVVNLEEYSAAIHIFNDINCDLGVSVDDCTMNIAINCYCLSNRVDYGFSILGWFFKLGFVPDVLTYDALLKGLFREKKISEAQGLFRKMVKEELCELSVVTYGTVIDGLCKSGNTPMAIEMLRVMENWSCKPDTDVYNMVIEHICYSRSCVDSALKIFDEMCEKDIPPDEVTFKALISGLCSRSRGRRSEVKMLIKKMIGNEIYTDVFTFNSYIDALCDRGLVDEAKDVLDIMKQQNVKPNGFTYSYFMDECCKQGRLELARDVFYSLRKLDYKFCPHVFGFDKLIRSLCEEGLVDEAKDVVDFIKQRKGVLDVFTYSSLMDGYCLQGRMDEARNVFDSLSGMNVALSIRSYNILIKGYCKKMKIDDAMDIFRKMPRKGVKPDVTTYNTILQGLSCGGRFSDALEIFDELQAVGLNPTFDTYSNILDGLCMNGQFERASLFLDELERREGKCLDITYYNIIIDGLCEAKKHDAAQAFFRNLSAKGVRRDVVTYTIMIKGCFQNGLPEEAKDLLVEMEQTSLLPNETTYNVVVQGFLMRGEYDAASKFLDKMVAKGFSPCSSVFGLMLDSLDIKEHDSPIFKFIRKWAPSTLTREDGSKIWSRKSTKKKKGGNQLYH
ncbi:hypothetical protein CASFOL_003644 [Castilleja foliolosa]|uniref:Pentatricopeptide repeat-containing protein n=1 Tax=Castilleja foliolosa TaxID=1961234 RepID=A0ABD3EHS8_9LAMI